MRFYAAAQLGPSQSLTPEGFLACRDTPIARIGDMAYVGDELPGLNAGPDGMIQVSRGEADLFADDAIASFEGKPVVIGHTWVTPKNWKSLAVGTMQNGLACVKRHSVCGTSQSHSWPLKWLIERHVRISGGSRRFLLLTRRMQATQMRWRLEMRWKSQLPQLHVLYHKCRFVERSRTTPC